MQDNRLMPLPAVDRALERPLPGLNQVRSYGPAANEPTQLRDYIHVVIKRKWLILSLCLIVTSLVTIQVFRQPSIYEAQTIIRIEQRKNNVLTTKEFTIAGQPDPNFWGTQLKLMQSAALARQVVLTLDLQNNSDFFGGQGQGGFFSRLRSLFSRQQGNPVVSPAQPSSLKLVTESQLQEQELTPQQLAALEPYEDMIIANEDVSGIVGTNLFTVKYRHTNPEIAQKVANTIAEVFAQNNLERSTSGSNKAEDILSRQIAALQTKIRTDQERQFNYARANNLPLTPSGTNVDDQRLAQLSAQLLAAQNDRKTAEAVYKSALEASDIFSVPDVQKSERVTAIRARLSALREKRDTLLVIYTPEWPEVKKIDAAIKPLELELKTAAEETIATLKAAYNSALAHERSIEEM